MKRAILITLLICFLIAVSITTHAEEDFMPGDILYTQPVKSVLFSHVTHVKTASLHCDICHPDIFQTRAFSVQSREDFNMKSLNSGKYCGVCHNGEMAFSSDTQCARCHIGVKGFKRVEGYIDKLKNMEEFMPRKHIILGEGLYSVRFSHNVHDSFNCSSCHTRLFGFSYNEEKITMDAIDRGEYCGACHNGEIAFSSTNCMACHEELAEK